MRLVTIQTKDVLEKMKTTGVYRSDINKIRYEDSPTYHFAPSKTFEVGVSARVPLGADTA